MTTLASAKSQWNVSSRAGRKKNPVAADKVSVEQGRVLWAKQCTQCHGSSGKGDGAEASKLEGGVPDLSKSKIMDLQSDGVLFRKLTVGRQPMPGYKKTISDKDRWHLVNYMRTLVVKAKRRGNR